MAAGLAVCGRCEKRGASIRSRSRRTISCPDHGRPALPAPSKIRLSISNRLAIPAKICCAGSCRTSGSSFASLRSAPARQQQDLSARIRQVKNIMSADALPYLLLAAIIGLGFAFRYHDFGAMSFDHDELRSGSEIERYLGTWFPI